MENNTQDRTVRLIRAKTTMLNALAEFSPEDADVLVRMVTRARHEIDAIVDPSRKTTKAVRQTRKANGDAPTPKRVKQRAQKDTEEPAETQPAEAAETQLVDASHEDEDDIE